MIAVVIPVVIPAPRLQNTINKQNHAPEKKRKQSSSESDSSENTLKQLAQYSTRRGAPTKGRYCHFVKKYGECVGTCHNCIMCHVPTHATLCGSEVTDGKVICNKCKLLPLSYMEMHGDALI